jgi:hypothetical protein
MSVISELLQEQYEKSEAYANAQTRLLNATRKGSTIATETTSLSTIDDRSERKAIIYSDAITSLYNAREEVRSNFRQLLKNDEIKYKYPEHIALSRRIVLTIANNPSWHFNGIPSGGGHDLIQTNTVAIAALKASITRILEEIS